mmetsp:Transcript_2287/g.10392  ORF Transcript_2287/g.10392 Transcript_2287/m.10392 type:complete len:201 (+) Transcript_2287:1163-1765(+)
MRGQRTRMGRMSSVGLHRRSPWMSPVTWTGPRSPSHARCGPRVRTSRAARSRQRRRLWAPTTRLTIRSSSARRRWTRTPPRVSPRSSPRSGRSSRVSGRRRRRIIRRFPRVKPPTSPTPPRRVGRRRARGRGRDPGPGARGQGRVPSTGRRWRSRAPCGPLRMMTATGPKSTTSELRRLTDRWRSGHRRDLRSLRRMRSA